MNFEESKSHIKSDNLPIEVEFPEVYKQKGFWCEGNCVWIEADDGARACEKYREKLSNAHIAVITHNPPSILYNNLRKKYDILLDYVKELSKSKYEHTDVYGAMEALREVGEE